MFCSFCRLREVGTRTGHSDSVSDDFRAPAAYCWNSRYARITFDKALIGRKGYERYLQRKTLAVLELQDIRDSNQMNGLSGYKSD